MNNDSVYTNLEMADQWLMHKNGHKYIEKHMGPSGKWVYKYYKAKSTRLGKKANKWRNDAWNAGGGEGGSMYPGIETTNIRKNRKTWGDKQLGVFEYRTTGDKWNPSEPLMRSGRPSSHGWDSGSQGQRNANYKRGGYSNSRSGSVGQRKVNTTKIDLNKGKIARGNKAIEAYKKKKKIAQGRAAIARYKQKLK